jgi:hypothetical protein
MPRGSQRDGDLQSLKPRENSPAMVTPKDFWELLIMLPQFSQGAVM